jgi:hypothetical protein
MAMLKKLRNWCPQPKNTGPVNFAKINPLIITVAVLAEILLLLIAPIAYYALLVPKPNYGFNQEFPLTNSQIKAAWSNLPTAQELVKNQNVAPIGGLAYDKIVNYTVVNPFLIFTDFNDSSYSYPNPMYYIYLYYSNSTTSTAGWVLIPQTYLATNHPPQIPSPDSGFLGTKLSTSYVTIAAIATFVTLLAGIGYLLHKKGGMSKMKEENYGSA